MPLELTDGWRERITIELLADDPATGLPTTASLTGTPALHLFPFGSTTAKAITGAVAILSAAGRTVSFDPGVSDLLASQSPYKVRVRLDPGDGKWAEFPQGAADTWIVRKP